MKRITRIWTTGKYLPLLTATMFLFACQARETMVDNGIRQGILHFGNASEPRELDPQVTTGVTEQNILSAVFEGLVTEEPGTLKIVPATAERWDVLDDGARYRFHIRPNARWSNGEPLLAEHFKYAFQRILSPEFGAPYAYMLYCIKGAEDFHRQLAQDFDDVGIAILDANILEITLHTPIPHFLTKLTHMAWFPVHPPTIEQHGGMTAIGTSWTRPATFVGNGPFALSQWYPNRHIKVVRNPHYWDRDKVKLNAIVFYPIGDHAIEERAFRAGQLHITGTVPVERIAYYQRNHPEILSLEPYLGTYYYLLNTKRPPLDNPHIRRALALTIDREQITRVITRAGETPAFHFTPPATGDYTTTAKLEGTPDEARQLLADAGFPGGQGFPVLTILYNTADTHARIAEAIQQMWRQQLGIRVELNNMDWKVYLDATQSGQYDIARAGWIGDYLDPETFLNLWVTDGGNNRTGWSHPEYDRLIRTAATTIDPMQRLTAFQQAEDILMQKLPVIPIYFYRSKSLIHPSVRGYYPNLLDRHSWKHIHLEHPRNDEIHATQEPAP
ncbi:MAG: peptide ABC transporter substrate-binding protein [Kiritimatiellia bacterium]